MGELIKFPGTKKDTERAASLERKESSNAYLDKSRLVEVLKILTALKNADIHSFGQHTINRRRELVSGYSDPELFGWINNYTEDNIKKRPSFFGAIIDELKFRNLY